MVEVAEYLNCIGVQCDLVFSSVVNRKVPDLECAMKHLKAGLKRARRRRAFGTDLGVIQVDVQGFNLGGTG